MRAQTFRGIGTLLLCALLSHACAPTVTNHGTPLTRIEQAQITPGIDTRGSVLRQLGRPASTGLIEGERWYYVATLIERELYYAPEVVDRRVLAVAFDETGLVTNVNEFGLEDGMAVALRTSTTPTYGRELTIAQQLFANVGRGAGLSQ